MGTLDGILYTVPVVHAIAPLLSLLGSQGKFVLIGAPSQLLEVPPIQLLFGKQK